MSSLHPDTSPSEGHWKYIRWMLSSRWLISANPVSELQ